LSAKILALSVPAPALPAAKPRRLYRPNGTKHISLCQADNIIDAAEHAGNIGLLLNAHCTIMWNGTDVFADNDGRLFAKIREGLSKWLGRRSIQFTAVWAREVRAQHYGQHVHMVLHLPSKYRKGKYLAEFEREVERLVDTHGGGIEGDWAVKITLHTNGDVRYLLKGGTAEVWRVYSVKRIWRQPQGIIFGKRSGTTENIGPKARELAQD